MAAITTHELKMLLLQKLFDDVADSAEHYYIGIGKSDDWDSSDTVVGPIQTFREIRNARLNLQGIKSAEDVSFVVPRANWVSGTIYNEWNDDAPSSTFPLYYVITSTNSVYLCIKQGKDNTGNIVASTVEPTGSSTTPIVAADGYIWKFLFTLTALNASKFLTANYIPVRKVDMIDSFSSGLDVEQYGIQTAAIGGQIANIVVTSGGTGYTSAPSVSIVGNGSGAAATATISNGSVVKIEMNNDSAAMGSGYDYAHVVLTGGGFTMAAAARPRLSLAGGFGADARYDLKASALMFNTKIAGGEGGDFITTNDFRQVVLVKNMLKSNDSDFSGGTANALRSLKFDVVTVPFTNDKIITGGTSGAKAYVDKYDDASSLIYYHQNENTGFSAFTEGENITEINGSGAGTLDSAGADGNNLADSSGEIQLFSGKVLYIDNRAAIDRSTEQTEDVKIVIKL